MGRPILQTLRMQSAKSAINAGHRTKGWRQASAHQSANRGPPPVDRSQRQRRRAGSDIDADIGVIVQRHRSHQHPRPTQGAVWRCRSPRSEHPAFRRHHRLPGAAMRALITEDEPHLADVMCCQAEGRLTLVKADSADLIKHSLPFNFFDDSLANSYTAAQPFHPRRHLPVRRSTRVSSPSASAMPPYPARCRANKA